MSKPTGIITAGGNRVIFRMGHEGHKFRGKPELRKVKSNTGLSPNHNDLLDKFRKGKFFITHSGKFRSRQSSGSYVENVFENEHGELVFKLYNAHGYHSYMKGDFTTKFFSYKINF